MQIDQKTLPFKIDFGCDFNGFGEGKWKQVGTKIDEHRRHFRKAIFLKNHVCLRENIDLKIQGVEVGSKNRLKVYQKMKSRWDGILASIFGRFKSKGR